MSAAPRSALRLRANLGAEEPGAPRVEAARAAARAWRLLFPVDAAWPDSEAFAWPEAIPRDAPPAFDWLPGTGLCAWWNDAESAGLARREGLVLAGADPAVVASVHDKAFAARLCAGERIGPRWLARAVRVFDPEELADADRFGEALSGALADWPAPLRAAATLKPRLGTSGRGRVRVRAPDDPELRGALPRLAACGGALLEPWLERSADYSVQLHLAPDGALTLLGTLALCVTPSGVYRGHRGELDHRGRVTCGAGIDDALLAGAAEVARAAHAAGYHGPCGVDAFSFRHEEETLLRPVVELNARFTTGTVAIGLLRRLRGWLDAAIPPEPGARRCFAFAPGGDAAALLPGATAGLALTGGEVAELVCGPGPLAPAEGAP